MSIKDLPSVPLTERERRMLRSKFSAVINANSTVNRTGLVYHYNQYRRAVDNWFGLVEQILDTFDAPGIHEINFLDHTARGKKLTPKPKRPREAA